MTKSEIGLTLAKARRRSGKTQAALAEAMGTTQPVIARAEAGYRMPTLGFIDRWARATGAPITLELGKSSRIQPASARRAMVRSVLGPGRFNPWDRNPAAIEAELLEQTGQSREHFDRLKRRRGDLYLDRLRQATVAWPREEVSFDSAFELALTNYVTMDWDYVRVRLRKIVTTERMLGSLMVGVNRRVRARARRGSLGATAVTRSSR